MKSPSLAFKCKTQNSSSVQEFLNSVTKTVENTQEQFDAIPKLSLEFPYRHCFESDVTRFVNQAVKSNVQELNLILKNGDHNLNAFLQRDNHDFHDIFPLPPFLKWNSFLEKLNLSMCSFDSVQEIKWVFLKELKIGHICLGTENNSYIEKIVAGCPVLEVLELCSCWGFNKLNFDNLTTLNKFVLNGIWPDYEKDCEILTISAPSVKILEILGNIDKMNLVLENMGNCVEAKIDYFWTYGEHNQQSGGCSINILQQVFNTLKDVQILTCGTWIIEIMSRKCETNVPFDLQKCNSLTLHTQVEYRYQRGILHFIESCPNVETLIIRASRSHPKCEICIYDCVVDDSKGLIVDDSSNDTATHEIRRSEYSENLGFRFKILKIFGCGEGAHYGNLPPFLKYLVDNANCWKKIVIE
ncbi:hypothetical protein ACJIZ3_006493 [Penstemon smallii]|uniref:At1g61320/AtMIF1 LRR domain-containing protein n=1 Tax=Penstemon smallii TaxID=265156 RepID=A0ABD3S8D4_9LAMI